MKNNYGELNMDKLKTRVLFVALIILALVSVSAVAAADVDDVVSADQDEIDLSEETVSDVQSAQETDVLTDDEPAQNPDGSSYITVKFSYMTEDGPVEVVNQSLSKKVAANKNLTITYSNLLNNKPPANRFQYNGLNYNFTQYWENSVTGDIFKQGRGCDQVFLATGYNYTVVLTAQYETYEDTFVNISYIVKDSSGKVIDSYGKNTCGDESGYILMAKRTDPGWTVLFPMADAIIIERGSILSHSAVVARELGITLVAGVRGLTQKVQDGDTVKVDGKNGTIEIIRRRDDKAD